MLASVGAITCLMRGNIGEVEAVSGGASFAIGVFEEVSAIVHAVGVAPSTAFIADTRKQLTAKSSPFASSMFRGTGQSKCSGTLPYPARWLGVGEGAGVLVLGSLVPAERRGAEPLAEIVGLGARADAYHRISGKPGRRRGPPCVAVTCPASFGHPRPRAETATTRLMLPVVSAATAGFEKAT